MDGNNLKRGKRRIEHWQIISALLMVYDFIAVCLAYFLALWLRFDGLVKSIPQSFYQPYQVCPQHAFVKVFLRL